MTQTDITTYKLNHTMIRIKEPKRSLDFYQDKLGMKLIGQKAFNESKFSLYFLGYDQFGAVNQGNSLWDREGILELTHNHGSENDDEFHVHSGNSEPKGFGHICISVDNITAACAKLENADVKFQKKLDDGRQRDIAFALDPDGYWVESQLIERSMTNEARHAKKTDLQSYRFNHTMIRIKDPKVSLPFYQNVMGMILLRTSEHANAKFTLYFLGYTQNKKASATEYEAKLLCSEYEGLLELTWNWGTETDTKFEGYNNGNSEPKGFGHLAVAVDEVEAACERFEEKGVHFIKKPRDGKMKNIAFIKDPDSYWIEIVPKNLQL
ncbi:Lactoylglutathione lyase [Neolecta irregularis DAH-3]|uniref:Lactoylglutathione lyase n=1 Tax=Neolecta irregularis (strain DAH-3) TaxID=1198029 RepID=A0A1U7LWH9_NEOID|nr:Lactoylglutathione lyase [Neolecta irregularis DAH-3]|eukprot:OLL26902.1 Lactoylglutathione lyase [Neolecta irregularis DAH-3]